MLRNYAIGPVGGVAFEKFEDAKAIDEQRREAIAKSIRIISVEELKKLGEEMFDDPDRPWRQTFLSLIAENPGCHLYHTSAGKGVIFLYSRDNHKGLWYLGKRPRGIVGGRPAADERSDRGWPSLTSHRQNSPDRFNSFEVIS